MASLRYPSLNNRDCDAIVGSLDVCLSILRSKSGKLSVDEVRLLSTLTALRLEMKVHFQDLNRLDGATNPPQDAKGAAESSLAET